MQNRENQEKDPRELVDLAWADMLVRLDEAMPVTPPAKRRRLAAWWWLAIGGLAIGLVVLGYKRFAIAPPALLPPAAPALPVGPQAGLAPASEYCPPLPSAAATAGSPTGARRQKRAPAAHDAYVASTEITPSNEGTANRLPPAMAAQWQPAIVHTAVAPTAATEMPPAPTPLGLEAPEVRASPAPVAVVELLPALTPDLLPALPAAGLSTSAAAVRAKRLALWSETGAAIVQASPEGIHAGIGADLQLGGRWALSAGLRYQFVRQRLVEEQARLFSLISQEDAGLDTGISVNNGFGLSHDPGPLKSHWLELPLGLQYRLGNRWQLNGGVYMGYLIRAYVPQGLQVEGNAVRSVDLSGGGGNNGGVSASNDPWYAGADASAVGPREVSPLQGGWWASIGYRPAPRWALSIGVRQGTGSWVDTAPYQLQRCYGQASLRYYWKR